MMIYYCQYHRYHYHYHSISGVAKNAPFGQSILTVEAIDSDVTSEVMQYDKAAETSGNFFQVDRDTGQSTSPYKLS